MNISTLKHYTTSQYVVPLFCCLALLVYGIFYVANALSPSSYGVVLKEIGAKSAGLAWGYPRIVMNDEWAVTTPLMQIAVNNHFERYNKTSPYKEDLRGIFSLPLTDWSLIFKPTMVWFHLLPPAYAFSLHYFLIMALFLVGYSVFFCRLGASYITGIGFALILYFSSFMQGWWFTLGPPLAFFPWVYLSLIWNKPLAVKAPAFYYLTTCMVFSWFYPIILYISAVTSLFFLWAFHRNFFTVRNIAIFGIAAILALGTYLFYIRDVLGPLANAVYPGKRSLAGGDVSLLHWMSTFFPSLNISGLSGEVAFKNTQAFPNNPNIVEISSVGSYLFLLILVLGKWRNYFRTISSDDARSLKYLGIGFCVISAWMLLPVPESLAQLIFLNKVPGVRWIFATGFFLLGISAVVLKTIEFSFSTARQLICIALVIGSCIFTSILYLVNPLLTFDNIGILLALMVLFSLKDWLRPYPGYYVNAIVVVAVISNLFVFIGFNPLQSAQPIFTPPETPVLQALRDKSNFNTDGFFVKRGLFGATANGLGLPSITHVLPAPALPFFRCYFPTMPEDDFNFVFNRFLIIVLSNPIAPVNVQMDTSLLPLQQMKSPDNPKETHECLQRGGYL